MYKGCVYVFHREWLPVLLISVKLSSLATQLQSFLSFFLLTWLVLDRTWTARQTERGETDFRDTQIKKGRQTNRGVGQGQTVEKRAHR